MNASLSRHLGDFLLYLLGQKHILQIKFLSSEKGNNFFPKTYRIRLSAFLYIKTVEVMKDFDISVNCALDHPRVFPLE